MPFLKKIDIAGGQLLLWAMNESPEEMLILGKDFTGSERFQAISNNKRQREWLAVRLLMREAGFGHLEIDYNDQGKPTIVHPMFRSISISHSDKLAGVLLHPSPQAGVDIESCKRHFGKVATKYLCEAEIQLAQQTPDGYGLFWCIKEAAYKAAGVPGLDFCSQIEILQAEPGHFKARVTKNGSTSFECILNQMDDQLVACLIALD